METPHGANVPVLNRDDVLVYEGRDREKVTDWVPDRGDHAGLQMFVLIDDASNTSLASQLEDVRQFITAQPSPAKVGVAYMQNGSAQILQEPTSDHALAAKALRPPLGVPGVSSE